MYSKAHNCLDTTQIKTLDIPVLHKIPRDGKLYNIIVKFTHLRMSFSFCCTARASGSSLEINTTESNTGFSISLFNRSVIKIKGEFYSEN